MRTSKCCVVAVGFIILLGAVPLSGQRVLTPADYGTLRHVSPDVLWLSPNGRWVTYTVSEGHPNPEVDSSRTHVWMSRTDGSESIQLTVSGESESDPRWSPDGARVAFLSNRGPGEYHKQLWTLGLTGGEAQKLTESDGDVVSFSWSPDGKRLALAIKDPDVEEGDGAPKPIVVTRYRFLSDEDGFDQDKRLHVYILTIATKELKQVTSGDHDDYGAEWSPDGSLIAFVSNRDRNWDRDLTTDVYVMQPDSEDAPRKLTSTATVKSGWLAWRPDSKELVFSTWQLEPFAYAGSYFSIVSITGKEHDMTRHLDRDVSHPSWSTDGKYLYGIVEDDGTTRLVRFAPNDQRVETVAGGDRVIGNYDVRNGTIVLTTSDPSHGAEVVLLDRKTEKRITHHSDAFFEGVTLGEVQRISFKSKDGTDIHGFLILPPNAEPDESYPLIVWLHGGPVVQYQSEFDLDAQILAGAGHAVLAVNPRGSSGRGEKFSAAIAVDRGNLDAQDILAGVDWSVARGIADPERLVIGGWSYGGILTNYVIAQDERFKAAVSGAGSGNMLARYGGDEHVMRYDLEMGYPWQETDRWIKLSSPFLHADRISTPTLFLVGELDRKVPLINSEQMYQALRAVGIDAQLVIYLKERHSLARISYNRDALERILGWYAKYLTAEDEGGEFEGQR